LALLNRAANIFEAQNALSEKRLSLEEKKYLLEEKKLLLEEEHRLIELQAHELKRLCETDNHANDPETSKVLKMMEKKIKNKWLSPM
jgi:PIN domain nuclease of toxin-antitoxin system